MSGEGCGTPGHQVVLLPGAAVAEGVGVLLHLLPAAGAVPQQGLAPGGGPARWPGGETGKQGGRNNWHGEEITRRRKIKYLGSFKDNEKFPLETRVEGMRHSNKQIPEQMGPFKIFKVEVVNSLPQTLQCLKMINNCDSGSK